MFLAIQCHIASIYISEQFKPIFLKHASLCNYYQDELVMPLTFIPQASRFSCLEKVRLSEKVRLTLFDVNKGVDKMDTVFCINCTFYEDNFKGI